MPQTAASYLASLPEVETARMPVGTLFVVSNIIYQIIDTKPGGYGRARQWRRDENTDVALVADSFLARTLPVVRKGRILPVYRSRKELLAEGQTTGFVFPTEALAKDAAYLDVSLILTAGAYVRAQGQEPAFAVTDGVQVFRLYYHGAHAIGRVVENPHCELHVHTDGPAYWRLLPNWKESFPAAKVTQLAMPPVSLQPTAPLNPVAHQAQGAGDTTQVTRAVHPDDPTPPVLDTDPDATIVAKAMRMDSGPQTGDETREAQRYKGGEQGHS